MAEISDIKSSNATIEILHPKRSEPIGLRLTLRPFDSPEVKRVTRRITDDAQKLRIRSKAFNAEEIDENKIDLMVAAIAGWDWYAVNPDAPDDVLTFHDAVPEFTTKNLKAVLNEFEWMHAQIDDAFGDTKLFFQS